MTEEEINQRIEKMVNDGLRRMAENGVHLNSGVFPDPRAEERDWWCYSTALAPGWLMLRCENTGAEGVVKDPTCEEWSWGYDCPSEAKRWIDSGRVTVMKEGEA